MNDIRALFRPFITLVLWGLAGWVFYEVLSGELREWIGAMEVQGLLRYMAYTVFFCASSATLWWFGDRALAPPEMKNL